VLEAVNEGQVFVALEHLVVLFEQLTELLHVSLLDTVHDLEVGRKRLLEVGLVEQGSSRNFSHQQIHNNKQLLDLNSEADGANLGTLSKGLDQASLSLGVLELDCLNAANVVQVARVLVVGAALGEGGLRDEVTGLLVQVLREVAPDNNVHKSCLSDLVVVQTAVLVGIKNDRSDLGQETKLLVRHGDEVHGFGAEVVQGAAVHVLQAQENKVAELFGL